MKSETKNIGALFSVLIGILVLMAVFRPEPPAVDLTPGPVTKSHER